MGDTNDGSSSAAQSAQDEPEPKGGFLNRLFGSQENPDTATSQQEAARVGLRRLNNLRVDDVMIPRANVVSANLDMNMAELVKNFRDSGFSRFNVTAGGEVFGQGDSVLCDSVVRAAYRRSIWRKVTP